MEGWEIVLIALGLAMDAFAVSITCGLTIQQPRPLHALCIATAFGGFQAFMPYIGWFSGRLIEHTLSTVDHWVAFILLGGVGLKMIYEGCRPPSTRKSIDPLQPGVLLFLAVATSIDALAVGISFAFLNISILLPVLTIGGITFILSYTGVHVGNRFGQHIRGKSEIFGGIILLVIGIKILAEHLCG